jgi:hypothetical protein
VASLQQLWAILDGHVKSRNSFKFVIPAKAGIQLNQAVLGSRLRGSDGFFDFLQDRQFSFFSYTFLSRSKFSFPRSSRLYLLSPFPLFPIAPLSRASNLFFQISPFLIHIFLDGAELFRGQMTEPPLQFEVLADG